MLRAYDANVCKRLGTAELAARSIDEKQNLQVEEVHRQATQLESLQRAVAAAEGLGPDLSAMGRFRWVS